MEKLLLGHGSGLGKAHTHADLTLMDWVDPNLDPLHGSLNGSSQPYLDSTQWVHQAT